MAEELRKVCLDTDVVIDYLKQTEDTENLMERLHLKFDEVALTAITVYLVWIPKYRRKILTGEIATRLSELMQETAQKNGIEILVKNFGHEPTM